MIRRMNDLPSIDRSPSHSIDLDRGRHQWRVTSQFMSQLGRSTGGVFAIVWLASRTGRARRTSPTLTAAAEQLRAHGTPLGSA